jgi:hypothetical protein
MEKTILKCDRCGEEKEISISGVMPFEWTDHKDEIHLCKACSIAHKAMEKNFKLEREVFWNGFRKKK